ncbi:MAG: TrkH family potassium uptake protein [Candidatus Cryptobacteroides sp.]
MNIKAVSTNVGKALLVSALFMFLSTIVSIIDGRDSAFGPLAISCLITLIVGAFPFIFVKKAPPLTLHDGFLTIVLSWLLSFIFGMLPYVLWGGEFTLVNAWFESVSGYTTTGATILTNVEVLPRSLLFWRTSTHFIGGLGVVVFLLLVMPDASPYRLKLTNMEMSSLSKEGYRYKSSKVVFVIAMVYLCLNVLTFLSLWIAGMPFFDAVNHAFTIVSTGGFSTKNNSIGQFGSGWINAISIIFMILSAIHFGVLYSVFATRSLKPLKNTVIGYYFGIIAFVSLLVAVCLKAQGFQESWGRTLFDSFYNVVSYMTSTGLAVNDNSNWPILPGMLLMFTALHCGCSGSTTGGFKLDRLIIALKSFGAEIKHRIHPYSVSQVRMDGHILQDSSISSVMMFLVLYLLISFVSIIGVMMCGTEPLEAFSGVFASMGCVGPGLGSLGSLGNYSAQPVLSKLIFTIDMFMGRIEIFPLLVAVSMIFERRK